MRLVFRLMTEGEENIRRWRLAPGPFYLVAPNFFCASRGNCDGYLLRHSARDWLREKFI